MEGPGGFAAGRRGMDRRTLMKRTLMAASGLVLAPPAGAWAQIAGGPVARGPVAGGPVASPSPYGYWQIRSGLPEFVYDADQDALDFALWDPLDRPETRRHFHMIGNRAIQAQVSNTGDIALFDESEAMRWLIYGDDRSGTGHGLVREADGAAWGSAWPMRPEGPPPQRTFGPASFATLCTARGLSLERTVLCPEGEDPGLMIRVRLSLRPGLPARSFAYEEAWALRPRFLRTWQGDAERDAVSASVAYRVSEGEAAVTAQEVFTSPDGVTGTPACLALHQLAPFIARARLSADAEEGRVHPVLRARCDIRLEPGEGITLWFRIGRAVSEVPADAALAWLQSQEALAARLPRAASPAAPACAHEIPWHCAVLTGGVSVDSRLGGHTMNQASIYGYGLGANAAARDALKHALPLVYSEPALALSVLSNTCAWASADGDLPYALNHDKQPITDLLRPSDQNLWALWLACEYAAATGDLEAFSRPQSFHPDYLEEPVTLLEHLIRQYRFFTDIVGRGERGHIRLMNADWNDMVLSTISADRGRMIASGGSVLNSAMASWVLSRFSGLLARLGQGALAAGAAAQAEELRLKVAASWNGRWVDRAYSPDGEIIGRDRCWLEVQPWAILCGAVTGADAAGLLEFIDRHHRANSPLGARIIYPADMTLKTVGQGTKGGIWYSINMTLIWAAAKIAPELAWDEWRRLSLSGHVTAYPEFWEGTLSGPDAWNAPESDRPGRTWTSPRFSQQSFPVNNMHAHAQPVLSYLRLLGVEPGADGSLLIRPGPAGPSGSYHSQRLCLNEDGSGWLDVSGQAMIRTQSGLYQGGKGRIAFSQSA